MAEPLAAAVRAGAHGVQGVEPEWAQSAAQLALGEHRVVDLTKHLNLAQSTVSKHLACLRDCGLVASGPEGRASVFSLTHPEAVLDLFSAAERLLGLTGDAVTLCHNYGTTTIQGA